MKYPRRRPTGHTCPRCGSDLYVYRSRTRTLGERLAKVFGRKPYRCDPCGYRFLATPYDGPRKPWGGDEGQEHPPTDRAESHHRDHDDDDDDDDDDED